MQFHVYFLAFILAAVFVNGSFFSDIVRGLVNSGRYVNLFSQIGQDATSALENDESEAGVFVCELLHGDIPDALEALGEDIVNEVTEDFDALTSFVMALPTLVPEVLSDIEQGGEDAISIIEELVTDPGGAITVIENGVKSVWTDVTNGVKSLLCDIGIGNCPSRTLSSSCAQILASMSAAQSTPAPAAATTTAPAAASSSYVQPQASPTTTPYAAATTTVNEAAASSSYEAAQSEASSSYYSSEEAAQSTYTTEDAPTETVVPSSADVSSGVASMFSVLVTLALAFVIML